MLVHFIGLNLDLAKQANLFTVSIQQNSWIQTSQTGGQPYSDISPYKVMSVLWFNIRKIAESNPVKQEVSRAVILPRTK